LIDPKDGLKERGKESEGRRKRFSDEDEILRVGREGGFGVI